MPDEFIHSRGQCGLYLDPQDCRGFKLLFDRPCQMGLERLELLQYALEVEQIFKDVLLSTQLTIEGCHVRLLCKDARLAKRDFYGIRLISIREKKVRWKRDQREKFVQWVVAKLDAPRF